MPKYEVEVKVFISVIVDADNATQARMRADRFVDWLSPTTEQITDFNTDHEPIGANTGPFDIDGRSCVTEIDE